MALPNTREYTVNTDTPITPGLLNALQDCIIGGKHPTQTLWLPPNYRTSANLTFTNGMVFANAPAAQFDYVSVPIREGSTIVGIRGNVKGTGAGGNVTIILVKWASGVQTTPQTLTIVTPPNAWANYNLAFADILVGPGESYWLAATLATTNQGISALGVDTRRV